MVDVESNSRNNCNSCNNTRDDGGNDCNDIYRNSCSSASTPLLFNTCTDGEACIKLQHLIHENSPAPIPDTTPESTVLDLIRKLFAEAFGTAILIIVVVGSGIMAETLSPTDVGLQLLQNAIATCGGLIGLILMFGPVSGAHFNPVVSLMDWFHGDMTLIHLGLYTAAQISGGILGTIVANIEFGQPICISNKVRDTPYLWLGEVIGTVTLLLLIHGCLRTGQKSAIPYAVAAWVCAGYFFTSSTIFANPAVTIARIFSNTFASIAPKSAFIFIGFQLLGAVLAFPLIKFFYPPHIHMNKDDNLYLRICLQQHSKGVCDNVD